MHNPALRDMIEIFFHTDRHRVLAQGESNRDNDGSRSIQYIYCSHLVWDMPKTLKCNTIELIKNTCETQHELPTLPVKVERSDRGHHV
jgi:hypothetical protein